MISKDQIIGAEVVVSQYYSRMYRKPKSKFPKRDLFSHRQSCKVKIKASGKARRSR